MSDLIHLALCAGKSVGTVLLVALAGVVLVRSKAIGEESIRVISAMVFTVMMPCLFCAKMAERVDMRALKELWSVPLCSALVIGAGLVCGYAVAKLCKAPREFIKAAVATSAFGNSCFIPLPLIVAVTLSFPSLGASKSALGISYVSLYILLDTFLFFSVAYWLLAGGDWRGLNFKKLLTPPMVGLLLGLLIGATPFLKGLFCGPEAPLKMVFDAADIVGSGTIPCALIVLGGRLANGPSSRGLRKRLVAGVIIAKLILLPALVFCFLKLLVWTGALPDDPLLATMIMIQAAAPPAATISVLCSLRNPDVESDLAGIMFWSYIASIPVLAAVITISMKAFS